MKKILYINGSPRGEEKSNSFHILKDIAAFLKEEGNINEEADILSLPRSFKINGDIFFEKMDSADIWIMALPLYVDSLPGHLCMWLKRYEEHRKLFKTVKNIKVYAVVNCGFPEAVQNKEALRILEIYCRKNRLDWRFGIGMGMGESYKQMGKIPLRSFVKSDILKSFRAVSADIYSESETGNSNMFVAVRFPCFLYRMIGSIGWVVKVKKNGLKKKDLYACPYQN